MSQELDESLLDRLSESEIIGLDILLISSLFERWEHLKPEDKSYLFDQYTLLVNNSAAKKYFDYYAETWLKSMTFGKELIKSILDSNMMTLRQLYETGQLKS